jgi:hypothetical protein
MSEENTTNQDEQDKKILDEISKETPETPENVRPPQPKQPETVEEFVNHLNVINSRISQLELDSLGLKRNIRESLEKKSEIKTKIDKIVLLKKTEIYINRKSEFKNDEQRNTAFKNILDEDVDYNNLELDSKKISDEIIKSNDSVDILNIHIKHFQRMFDIYMENMKYVGRISR